MPGTSGMSGDNYDCAEFLRWLCRLEPDLAEGIIYRSGVRMVSLDEYLRRGLRVLVQHGYL